MPLGKGLIRVGSTLGFTSSVPASFSGRHMRFIDCLQLGWEQEFIFCEHKLIKSCGLLTDVGVES